MARSFDLPAETREPGGEIDLRGLGATLRRRARSILLATLIAFGLVTVFVNVVTPRYTAQTQILLENQETVFTRPERASVQADQASQLDPEAVASQVQLVNSRDIARRAIKRLGLEGDPEFDPRARAMGALQRVLVLIGLARDPTQESRDARIVTAFLDKLTVYSPPKTRVITIEFTSRDPDLAARGANTVAALYLEEQSAAKRATAKDAADALAAQVADLRTKLAKAADEREAYRSTSGLLAGTNNMTISGQQLADINTDLSKARSEEADAQAKATMIRELLHGGKAADVAGVVNNESVRRVSDQRVTAAAQLALESRTLLPGHPRIKALAAQVAEYDLALKRAARQAADTLENEAKIAGARVANLETVLSQQKTVAGAANVDEVHLRALEQTAQSYKDQLESTTTKYQEALARQSSSATPADARIISRAVAPQEPSFPKKLPFILFATIATLVFAVGFVIAGELLSGRAAVDARPVTVVRARHAAAMPVEEELPAPVAAAGEHGAERMPEDDLVFSPVAQDRVEHRIDTAVPPVAASHAGSSEPTAVRSPAAKLRSLVGGLAAGGVLGGAVERMRLFGQSAVASRGATAQDEGAEARSSRAGSFGWDDEVEAPVAAEPASDATHVDAAETQSLSDRIIAAHVPGRGLHVVGTSIAMDNGAVRILIDLSRTLADRGRSIIVDLNRTPYALAPLAQDSGDARAKIMALEGLAELLAGDASFADVIHRDHATRLHFIPTGRQEADFRDFDLILEALSETYDFIILLAPTFPNSEIAKIMAPYADFVVLTAIAEPDQAMLAEIESELFEAGAREVLVAGFQRSADARDVA